MDRRAWPPTAAAAAAAAPGRPDQRAPPRTNVDRDAPVSWATDVTTMCIVCAAQLFTACSTFRRGGRGGGGLLLRASPFIIMLLYAAGLAVALCARQFHMRHRTALLMGVRLGCHLLPSARSPSVGTALALHRAAQPGTWGAVQDMLLRTLTGNRTLPLLVMSSYAMLPPVATLFMSAAMTALQWNSAGYCAMPLLSDPLSQRRQAALAAALEYASLPLATFQPLAGHVLSSAVLAGGADPAAACHATHSFLHVCCGALAPVFFSAWCWPPSSAAAEPAAGGSAATTWRRSLLAAGQRAAAALDAQLRLAAGTAAGPCVRALLVWYVLVTAWLACKVFAEL